MLTPEQLVELIKKISKSVDHVKIVASYDGGGNWHCKVIEVNVTAGQWTPKGSKLEKKFPVRHGGNDEHIRGQ